MKAKDILAAKGTDVIKVSPSTFVLDAMRTFSANRIGSLLVADEKDNILGIIGARDVLMAVLNHLDSIKDLTVDKIMTTNLIVATEEDNVDYIQAIMTENRIRHVPIIDKKKLIGIVSIGDVVKAQLKEVHVENHYLKDYIADKYPG